MQYNYHYIVTFKVIATYTIHLTPTKINTAQR